MRLWIMCLLSLWIVLAILWFGLKMRNAPVSHIVSLSTNTLSSQFATREESVSFLERYLHLPTPVEDTAYHIIYHDNSQGVPGPSDWDMKIAVKVLPENLDTWLEGYSPADVFDVSWALELLKENAWILSGEPEFYTTSGANMVVFENDGILVKWLSTN